MITKIISVADIHIPSLKGLTELKSVMQTFIDKCKKIVEEEDDPSNVRIVIAGDIFNQKIDITNESQLCANWFFKELDAICKTIVIIGNHDFLMNNKDRVDSLSPLFEIGDYKQVVFLDKECDYKSGVLVDDNVVWCLYSSFSGFNTPDIAMTKEYYHNLEINGADENEAIPTTYVGLIHGDVNGAITVTNYVTENGIDPGVFEECDFVIAGHIHKRQEIKKNGVRIVYCSSLKQKDMGESVCGHGFVLWDIEDPDEYTYKYIEVPNPDGGFYKFEVNDYHDISEDKEELINY